MFNSDGTPQSLKLQAIARTYAYAFQGTPSSMFFSTEDASFTTSFALDTSITALTEIYLNYDLFYPNGAITTVSDSSGAIAATITEHQEDNYLSVALPGLDLLDYRHRPVAIPCSSRNR